MQFHGDSATHTKTVSHRRPDPCQRGIVRTRLQARVRAVVSYAKQLFVRLHTSPSVARVLSTPRMLLWRAHNSAKRVGSARAVTRVAGSTLLNAEACFASPSLRLGRSQYPRVQLGDTTSWAGRGLSVAATWPGACARVLGVCALHGIPLANSLTHARSPTCVPAVPRHPVTRISPVRAVRRVQATPARGRTSVRIRRVLLCRCASALAWHFHSHDERRQAPHAEPSGRAVATRVGAS